MLPKPASVALPVAMGVVRAPIYDLEKIRGAVVEARAIVERQAPGIAELIVGTARTATERLLLSVPRNPEALRRELQRLLGDQDASSAVAEEAAQKARTFEVDTGDTIDRVRDLARAVFALVIKSAYNAAFEPAPER